MSQYDEFVEAFDKNYESIHDFIDDMEYKNQNPLAAEVVEDNDNIEYDSYGNECSKLSRVFYFPKYEIWVQFSGTRESYNGEEWNRMEQVIPTIKTINVFEPVNK